MKAPLVTVVVTTKNSDHFLQKCLDSIQKQSYSPIELIIIDNNSTDKTLEIAKKFTNKLIIKGSERSEQRNIGIRKATGKYILFLDSDMYLSTNVIRECVGIMCDSEIKGVYIPEKILGDSYWSKVRNFERSFYNGTVIDAVRFFRKNDFEKIGGFDETLTGPEDWDFDKRIRKLGKTSIIESCLFHDESDFDIRDYLHKKTYYIADFSKYKEKWPNDPDLKRQFGWMYRYLTVFIEKGKWIRIIKHPKLAFGMFFLRILVGLSYIFHTSFSIISFF